MTRIVANVLQKYLTHVYQDAAIMLPGSNPAGEEIGIRCVEYNAMRGRVYLHSGNPDWQVQDDHYKQNTQVLFAQVAEFKEKDIKSGLFPYCLRAKDLIKYLDQCFADAVVMLPGPDINAVELHSVEYDTQKERVYLHSQNPPWRDSNVPSDQNVQVMFVKVM